MRTAFSKVSGLATRCVKNLAELQNRPVDNADNLSSQELEEGIMILESES